MKEFFTDDYVKLIKDSLENQASRAFENYGLWKSVQRFFTSLDLGRQTGKTESITKLTQDVGGVVVYVGHNMQAARDFNSRGGVATHYTSKGSNLDALFRGRSIDSNRLTLVFDECDMSFSEMDKIAQTAGIAMRTGDTWGKYVHVIRLGM